MLILFVWQLPSLPGGLPPSTIGVRRLNFCVRYGNRCIPSAIVTRYFIYFFNLIKFYSRFAASAPHGSSLSRTGCPPRAGRANSIAINISSQESKGTRWMPWHMKAKKDVSERKLG